MGFINCHILHFSADMRPQIRRPRQLNGCAFSMVRWQAVLLKRSFLSK